jgi:hypothetical protein
MTGQIVQSLHLGDKADAQVTELQQPVTTG